MVHNNKSNQIVPWHMIYFVQLWWPTVNSSQGRFYRDFRNTQLLRWMAHCSEKEGVAHSALLLSAQAWVHSLSVQHVYTLCLLSPLVSQVGWHISPQVSDILSLLICISRSVYPCVTQPKTPCMSDDHIEPHSFSHTYTHMQTCIYVPHVHACKMKLHQPQLETSYKIQRKAE